MIGESSQHYKGLLLGADFPLSAWPRSQHPVELQDFDSGFERGANAASNLKELFKVTGSSSS